MVFVCSSLRLYLCPSLRLFRCFFYCIFVWFSICLLVSYYLFLWWFASGIAHLPFLTLSRNVGFHWNTRVHPCRSSRTSALPFPPDISFNYLLVVPFCQNCLPLISKAVCPLCQSCLHQMRLIPVCHWLRAWLFCDPQVFFIHLVIWVGICRLQRLICIQTLHVEFCSDLFAMSFFVVVSSASFLQIRWFRFAGSDSFLKFVCSYSFVMQIAQISQICQIDLFVQISQICLFVCFFRLISSDSFLQIRFFRFLFFMLVCSYLIVQICWFVFYGSDSFVQILVFRFVFVQIRLFRFVFFSDLFLQSSMTQHVLPVPCLAGHNSRAWQPITKTKTKRRTWPKRAGHQ